MWPGAGGGDDDDLFCEGRANMEQQGNEQQRFPTLVVAGSNNTPTEEFVKLPIKMLYLNVKLSHNELPSFATGVSLARKQKMYVERVILIFDLFATDADLDSFRQVSGGYKNRTGAHRAAVEVIDAAVRLFFATLFADVIGKVPPNLTKKAGGGAVPELKLSTIHTLLERLVNEKSLKLHGANQREALREACLEFRKDSTAYKRDDFVFKVLQNKKQKVFGEPATVQEVDEAGDE